MSREVKHSPSNHQKSSHPLSSRIAALQRDKFTEAATDGNWKNTFSAEIKLVSTRGWDLHSALTSSRCVKFPEIPLFSTTKIDYAECMILEKVITYSVPHLQNVEPKYFRGDSNLLTIQVSGRSKMGASALFFICLIGIQSATFSQTLLKVNSYCFQQ